MPQEHVIYIQPGKTGTQYTSLVEEMAECLKLTESELAAGGIKKKNVLKQSVFLEVADNKEFHKVSGQLSTALKSFYRDDYPATGFIGQPPMGGGSIAMELTVLSERDDSLAISRKDLDGIRYITIDTLSRKKIYASGITANRDTVDILTQSTEAFNLMKRILQKEKMDFSHVVRQWNYIEGIVEERTDDGQLSQNYQVFNDVRSVNYKEAEFIDGYPAATGIGMTYGGVVLEFTAVDIPGQKAIFPIQNPGQIDAHRYSQEVLIGKAAEGLKQKTTPKFERAKAVESLDSYCIYISGTAAIQGQQTISSEVGKQTHITIDNISHLVSRENLRDHGMDISSTSFGYTYIRVYIKYKNDMEEVKRICEERYAGVPTLYVVADICRPDLLVEIEGAGRAKTAT
ncbi:MAG: hypothetical protein GY765_32675 [bacterium]|nr:hypothetical protein [bacterium]